MLQLERLQAARSEAREQRWLAESAAAVDSNAGSSGAGGSNNNGLFHRAKLLRRQLDAADNGASNGNGNSAGAAADARNRRRFLEAASAHLAACWVAEERRQLPASEARRLYRELLGFVRHYGRRFAERDRQRVDGGGESGGSGGDGVACLTEVCVLLVKSVAEFRLYGTYRCVREVGN